MTLTLDLEGQNLKMLYLRSEWSDRHETKKSNITVVHGEKLFILHMLHEAVVDTLGVNQKCGHFCHGISVCSGNGHYVNQ